MHVTRHVSRRPRKTTRNSVFDRCGGFVSRGQSSLSRDLYLCGTWMRDGGHYIKRKRPGERSEASGEFIYHFKSSGPRMAPKAIKR